MSVYEEIVKELRAHGIFIIDETQLNEEQGSFVKKYFQEQVRVGLFPIMISNLREISSLVDKSIYLAVKLGHSDRKVKDDFALIELPTRSVSVSSFFHPMMKIIMLFCWMTWSAIVCRKYFPYSDTILSRHIR